MGGVFKKIFKYINCELNLRSDLNSLVALLTRLSLSYRWWIVGHLLSRKLIRKFTGRIGHGKVKSSLTPALGPSQDFAMKICTRSSGVVHGDRIRTE